MRKFLFFISFFALFIGIQAQDSNSELLKKLVEKNVLTQDEANQITSESAQKAQEEPKQSLETTALKIRDAFNTPYLKFGGYGLLTYKYNQYSKNHHDFRVRAVFLSMTGKLTNSIGYNILFELVDPTLTEYYAEWTPLKSFNLRGGQFKVPFSLENPISLTNLETIYYTRSISSLVGMADDVVKQGNSHPATGRDLGVQISGSLLNRGDFDLIEYRMGIFQGAGINISDNNNDKDFAGMLLLQPIKGLRMGGGAYFGEANYILPKEIEATNQVRNRWIISSEYQSKRLYARAEWIHGKDGVIKKEGLYGTALYYVIPNKLNILGKVDYFNKDKDTNSEVIDYTCGINYYFFPQCRFQLNYTFSDYSKKWDARNTNMVAAQMQIVF